MNRVFLMFPAAAALWLAGCAEKPAPSTDARPPDAAGEARITQFYAYPNTVSRGNSASVCYGVENVKSVRIEPPVEELRPAANRCIAVSPETTTRYTLVAEGADGRTLRETVTVTVSARAAAKTPEPAAQQQQPLIVSFSADKEQIKRGDPVTLCYETGAGAKSVRITPPVVSFALPLRGCFGHAPAQTTTYSLEAAGNDGGTAAKSLRVEVQER